MSAIRWEDVLREHGPAVWRTSYRLLGDHEEASDCFQETFLCALRFSSREPVRDFAALLVRLATLRAIDRLRAMDRSARWCSGDAPLEVVPSGHPGPAERAQGKELASMLREALGRLPPREAEVFCLRHLSEMSYRGIARELGLRTNAVGVLLYRARRRLRLLLSRRCETAREV